MSPDDWGKGVRRSSCEGRPLRWRTAVGGDAPFIRGGLMRSINESHPTRGDDDHQEQETREIVMYVMRDGAMYEARAKITYDVAYEGSPEWMASAIALMDISVDMGEALDAEPTD